MIRFLLRRILKIPLTLLIVSLICFFCIKSIPYNPIDFILNLEQGESTIGTDNQFNKNEYARLAKQMGLDKPIFYFSLRPQHVLAESAYNYPQVERDKINRINKKGYKLEELDLGKYSFEELSNLENNPRFSFPSFKWHGIDNQYHDWLLKIAKGDFGVSYLDNRPAAKKIIEALKWTLFMVILALLLAFIIGIAWGVNNYTKSDRPLNRILNQLGYFMYVMPLFWIGTVAMAFLTTDDYGSWTNWFSSGNVYIDNSKSFFENLFQHFEMILLPTIVLCIGSLIYIARQMENALEQERHKVYADVAMVKGLTFKDVLMKHQFKNALLPIITLFTSALPASIAGSLIVETIFNIPGMGRLLYNSINLADWNVAYGIILLTALITALSYILADLLYYRVNPKISK